jgi:DNA-binding transcriptional MerR regulator
MNPKAPKTKAQIEKLKEIGYSQEKIDTLIELLAPDIEEDIFNKFIDKSSKEKLEEYKDKLVTVSTKEDYKKVFNEIAQEVFGGSWKEEIDKIWAETLQGISDDTLKIRDTYHKYMQGDPNTVAKIKELENSKEVQKELEDMKKDGFDFLSEAVK